MDKTLQVKCKAKNCAEWLIVARGGLRRTRDSYSFPVLIASWELKLRCSVCGEEHVYSHRDARDPSGFFV